MCRRTWTKVLTNGLAGTENTRTAGEPIGSTINIMIAGSSMVSAFTIAIRVMPTAAPMQAKNRSGSGALRESGAIGCRRLHACRSFRILLPF